MRRRLIASTFVLTLAVLFAFTAAPAGADPANKNTLELTLTCGSAPPIDAVFELSSADSFHIVSMSSNFLWKSLSFVASTGETVEIDRGIQGDGHQQLVTCTYTGPVSGNRYTVTGFFTP
jgi:hypothetical protein